MPHLVRPRGSTGRTALVLAAASACPACVCAQSDPLAEPFEPAWNLADLQPSLGADGTHGFLVRGPETNIALASAIAPIGDLNGDGVVDLFLGSYDATPGGLFQAGWGCVIFGRRGQGGQPAFPPLIDLASLDGTNGFLLPGLAGGDRAGQAGAAAGDLNGDGVDDAIFGAGGIYPPGRGLTGQAFVLFGRSAALGHEPFPPAVVLENMEPGEGVRFYGTGEVEYLGGQVRLIGDINADGLDDLALAAHTTDIAGDTAAGAVYVVYGRDVAGGGAPWPAEVDVSALDGTDGFALVGWLSSQYLGGHIASGDLNGDGHPELFATTQRGDAQVCVLYGGRTGYPATIDVRELTGDLGFTIGHSRDILARCLSASGDLDGDGLADLLVGTRETSRAYVLYGRSTIPWPDFVDIDDMPVGSVLTVRGPALSITGAGGELIADVNGDGRDDLLLGASRAGPSTMPRAGETYVLYGRTRLALGATIDLRDLAPAAGTRIGGFAEGDESGGAVAGIGDINADGRMDFATAARRADRDGFRDAGEVAIIYGRSICVADFDRDGALTIFDYLAYQSAFDRGDAAADLDGDGTLTIADFLVFCNAFDAGCE